MKAYKLYLIMIYVKIKFIINVFQSVIIIKSGYFNNSIRNGHLVMNKYKFKYSYFFDKVIFNDMKIVIAIVLI